MSEDKNKIDKTELNEEDLEGVAGGMNVNANLGITAPSKFQKGPLKMEERGSE